LMRDPVYQAGNHCYGLGIVPSNVHGILSDMVTTIETPRSIDGNIETMTREREKESSLL
jgi:hypothetical protein